MTTVHICNTDYIQAVLDYFNNYVKERHFAAELLIDGKCNKFFVIFPKKYDKILRETIICFYYHQIVVKDGDDILLNCDYDEDFYGLMEEAILRS